MSSPRFPFTANQWRLFVHEPELRDLSREAALCLNAALLRARRAIKKGEVLDAGMRRYEKRKAAEWASLEWASPRRRAERMSEWEEEWGGAESHAEWVRSYGPAYAFFVKYVEPVCEQYEETGAGDSEPRNFACQYLDKYMR